MAKALVVVESPAKAKTINKYLGRGYKVIASMGHIRDLPKSKLGVDVDNDFAEHYESIASRKKVIQELKDAAKQATDIYVATDPDREGEAIGWHLAQELGGKKRKIHRLMFNEITKKAIQEAFKHPKKIDEKLVNAQRARRVLDRLVGYKISPLLWDKVRRGLSAGRVQSVALKLVCDRERKIEKFVPEEYWNVFARLAGPQPPEFEAKLVKKSDDAIRVGNEEQSKAILADLEHASWIVSSVTTKERRRHAPPPFITSKLQQTARFPVKKTMMLAQQLYEGVELPGLVVEAMGNAFRLLLFDPKDLGHKGPESVPLDRQLFIQLRIPDGQGRLGCKELEDLERCRLERSPAVLPIHPQDADRFPLDDQRDVGKDPGTQRRDLLIGRFKPEFLGHRTPAIPGDHLLREVGLGDPPAFRPDGDPDRL